MKDYETKSARKPSIILSRVCIQLDRKKNFIDCNKTRTCVYCVLWPLILISVVVDWLI